MNDIDLFVFDKPRRHANIEDLIADIRAFSAANGGRPVSQAAYKRWSGGRFSSDTIRRVAGGWRKACIAADVKPAYVRQYDDRELVEHYEAVWRWRGQRITRDDIKKYNALHGTTISPDLYYNRWGSTDRFCRLFCQYKQGQISLQELIDSKVRPEDGRRAISPKLRAAVLKRDNYTCQDCGANRRDDPNVKLHVHHKVPVSQGGTNDLDNLITNCKDCNQGKSDKILN